MNGQCELYDNCQIVNFIILLWILAKFAYKPLLKAMDDRRNRIVKDLDSAEHARKEAETLKLEYANQLKTARKEASDIIAKANADAQKLHDEALAQAQKERDALLESGRERVEAEKKKALLDVREQVIASVQKLPAASCRQNLPVRKTRRLCP